MTVECGMRCGCICCSCMMNLAVDLCLRCRLCDAVSVFFLLFVFVFDNDEQRRSAAVEWSRGIW